MKHHTMTKREFLRLQGFAYAKAHAPRSFNAGYQGRALVKGKGKGVGFKWDKNARDFKHQCRIER